MLYRKLLDKFPAIKINEPLKKYCTFAAGGPAEFFFSAHSKEQLTNILNFSVQHKIPYFIFGAGSNILFPDDGLKGIVIKNLSHKIEFKNDTVIAESGAVLAQILSQSLQKNLIGLEELIGLPGTIGGAVRGNAGAYNTEIKNLLDSVEVFMPEKGPVKLEKDDLNFRYRHSTFKENPGWTILEVILKLKQAETAQAKQTIKDILANRKGKQPGGHNTGSFFKNPSKDQPAGWLIDQAGLKGYTIGDAQISQVHANFFQNLGNATAKDILELAEHAKQKVFEKFGIRLEEEVMILK